MFAAHVLRRCLIIYIGLLAGSVWAAECRIAYDMGSSGIRAGVSGGRLAPRADIDFLAPLAAGRNLNETLDTAIPALNELPRQGGFGNDCQRVGGGFSAWRLALQHSPDALIPALRRIRAQSGVSVLVIPQQQEGAYGYAGARQLLGDRLKTSHVLDIGGGSLQVAGASASYGEALGQKIWHGELCRKFAKLPAPCDLQALNPKQLAAARQLAKEKLGALPATLSSVVTMTAISRPVSRGILPALPKLTATPANSSGFSLATLSAGIERLAALNQEAAAKLTGTAPKFLTYLLSDMLLVEGVLRASGVEFLQVAEIDLTNLPGLLVDDRAFGWGQHYDCYLERLQKTGLDAYASDPASCP